MTTAFPATMDFPVDLHETMPTGAGPIARIRIPFRLRNQAHGTWVPETEMSA